MKKKVHVEISAESHYMTLLLQKCNTWPHHVIAILKKQNLLHVYFQI